MGSGYSGRVLSEILAHPIEESTEWLGRRLMRQSLGQTDPGAGRGGGSFKGNNAPVLEDPVEDGFG